MFVDPLSWVAVYLLHQDGFLGRVSGLHTHSQAYESWEACSFWPAGKCTGSYVQVLQVACEAMAPALKYGHLCCCRAQRYLGPSAL